MARWQWAWRPQGPVLSPRHARAAIKRSLHEWDRRRWNGLLGKLPAVDAAAYRQFLRETLWKIAGHPVPSEETEAVVDRFPRYHGELERFDDVRPALAALRTAGFPLGAVAGVGGSESRENLRRRDLLGFFAQVVGELTSGPQVPAAAAFRAACGAIGSKPKETVYVGDLFWSDARAAARAGLRAILIDRNDWWPRVSEGRLRTLSELPAALEKSLAQNETATHDTPAME